MYSHIHVFLSVHRISILLYFVSNGTNFLPMCLTIYYVLVYIFANAIN